MIHYVVVMERQVVRVRRAVVEVDATDGQDAYAKARTLITDTDWVDDLAEIEERFTDVEVRAQPDMWVHGWRDEGGR